jgi:hypothetical protein
MYVEIFITAVIVTAAAIIFVRNLRKKSKAKCDCGSCGSRCGNYKEKK